MTVDPEEFAAQVNYLAALGRMIVPRAFSFAGGRVLFVGHEPFDAWELGSLLPEEVEWYEQEDAPAPSPPASWSLAAEDIPATPCGRCSARPHLSP